MLGFINTPNFTPSVTASCPLFVRVKICSQLPVGFQNRTSSPFPCGYLCVTRCFTCHTDCLRTYLCIVTVAQLQVTLANLQFNFKGKSSFEPSNAVKRDPEENKA